MVATDDERIAQAVAERGGEAVMTSPHHQSGTDRLAEVAEALECDLVVNVQGDEPFLNSAIIAAAVEPFQQEPDLRMATVATPVRTVEEYLEPSVVKVVRDEAGCALYFSRSPLPCFRVDSPEPGSDNVFVDPVTGLEALKHIGLYVYRRETLLWLQRQPPTRLEQAERLEQLRALGRGCPIRVVVVDYSPLGVDTPGDLERARLRGEREGLW
jgi:3-deoxy-manno-octulosonate cytidylyltransferase (CMP-KDO synthetase)